MDIHWLPRDEGSQSAFQAVTTATMPGGSRSAFVAGGQKLVTGIRRHLVTERGYPKEHVTFTGYWR